MKNFAATPPTDDQEIVRRSLDGEPGAFNQLVSKYEHMVFHLALRIMKSREDAEDVTQEVFLNAYNHLADYQSRFKFSTWLLKITKNQALYRLRGAKSRPVPADDLEALTTAAGEAPQSQGFNPEEEAERQEFKDTVLDILQTLPEKYRLTLLLRHLFERSYQDISDILEMNIGTVKTNIHLGRKLLRQKLEARRMI
ncbi:MAG: RNA polymerase sigma factor [Candidatus Riflebacteria bacterium]|nr:RNA polymerase sigma factor [Candidatus Riflebacteria bacterium]